VFTGGRASGRSGMAFYMVVKNTDGLESDRGVGGFHASIITTVFKLNVRSL
jgi:hypothetical protein